MDRIKLAVVIVLLVNTVLVMIPALVFNLPVVQTDGATHYVYAKLYIEQGLDAKNPAYNIYGSAEKKISDYPPFTTVFFGNILRVFGNDLFWINGGLGLIFILIGAVSLYFFVRDVFKNRTIALISLLFFILNLRIYYTLFVGTYPALIATCLSIPALYFSYRFFSTKPYDASKPLDDAKHRLSILRPSVRRKISNFFLMLIMTSMVIFTYPVMSVYLIFLEFFLWLGIKSNEKIEIRFPKIELRVKKYSAGELKKLFAIMIPLAVIFSFALFSFTINEARFSWISEFRSEMFKQCPGYPCVWKYFPIMDGPLLLLFAALGFIYLMYKNKWDMFFLLLGGIAIVLLSSIIVSGIVYLIYRFYILFSVLLAIPASLFMYKIISIKELKKIGIFLLVITLIVQSAILAYFYIHVQPAISVSEVKAANILYQHKSENILYLVKEKESGSFKSFKWVLVYAKSEHYITPQYLDSSINITDFNYVFVNDKTKLTNQEANTLSGFTKIFDEGSVQIYKT